MSGFTSGVTQISAGVSHTCAVRIGAAYCWGLNRYGEIGDSTLGTSYATPVAVRMPTGVTFVDIGAGANTTCAAASTGDVYCWGASGGSVFSSVTGIQRIPTKVAGASGVVRVSVGTLQACALTAAGSAYGIRRCTRYLVGVVAGTVIVLVAAGIAFSIAAFFRSVGGRSDDTQVVTAHALYWYVLTAAFTAVWFVVYVQK